jgi:O-antigen ligase
MLMVVSPFALVRMFDSTTRRSRLKYASLFTLMLAAAAATDRKTALIVPIAIVLYFGFYRRRQVLRILPIGLLALLGLIHFASPGSLGTILNPSAALESNSTTHRTGDFENVEPDVLAHPLLGRGYGTLDTEKPNEFRINDNEYIDEIWQVGVVGLVAYLFMVLAPILLARRRIRERDPRTESLALAGSAGCVAYLVVNALFDAMSFPQAPYMFFFVAALTTIAAAGPAGNVEPVRERARQALAGSTALVRA